MPEAAAVPDSILVRVGACPFECCTYQEWVAESAIPLSSAELSEVDTVFVLDPGEAFTAVTGNVHVTRQERAAVMPPANRRESGGEFRFEEGDTVVVLDYLGEGIMNVWFEGAVHQIEAFWLGDRWAPPSYIAGVSFGPPVTEWWVQARNAAGRTGWFKVTPATPFGGADACS